MKQIIYIKHKDQLSLNPKRDKKMTLKRFYMELLALVVVGYMGMGMAFAAGTITGVVTDKEGAPLLLPMW